MLSSISNRTNLACNSMKKSGSPTISASPRAFRLMPANLPSGPHFLPLRKALVGVLWLLLLLPFLSSLPLKRGLFAFSARSSSASARDWIHAARSRNAEDKYENVCIAARSRWVLSAIRAYTRRRPRALGSGIRNM
jgi:hypothetical protein